MNQESVPTVKGSARVSKTLVVGVLVLAFGALSIAGNYVQWAGAVRTRARILTAKEQWVRRGSNYLKLQVAYDVDGRSVTGEVYAMPDELSADAGDGGIDVVYKKESPSRVIAEATLQEKRKLIPWIISARTILTAAGLYLQFATRSDSHISKLSCQR